MEQLDYSLMGMIRHMSMAGWGVLIALIIMSVWSFSITFDSGGLSTSHASSR